MVRSATYWDVPRIMEVCSEARGIMRASGNMNQWTGGYPSEEAIKTDIDNGVGFVIVRDESIEGYFAFIKGIDPTYLKIEGGKWLDEESLYGTIHRLGSTVSSHGVALECFDWCWEQLQSLRIDTHEDNTIMRHCIENFGFEYCGIIHIRDGSPRLAYQKITATQK